jgi:hypothetical protein
MKSQPVKVRGQVVGRVEQENMGEPLGITWGAYRSLPDGTEKKIGTFGGGRSEAARLRAIAAVKDAAGEPAP